MVDLLLKALDRIIDLLQIGAGTAKTILPHDRKFFKPSPQWHRYVTNIPICSYLISRAFS
ncbi:MAG: hypothetical protein DMF20_01190 [Verrucomicrobia bacterium]|nr:MAG: hypothetical protein DMF20_01190 [Verrucomicrobiota bacterium]